LPIAEKLVKLSLLHLFSTLSGFRWQKLYAWFFYFTIEIQKLLYYNLDVFNNKVNIFMLYIIILFFILANIGYSDVPSNIIAFDTPNDNGSSITIQWDLLQNNVTGYIILRGIGSADDMKIAGRVEAIISRYEDKNLVRGKSYYYVVQAQNKEGEPSNSAALGPVVPTAQWLNRAQIPTGVGIIIFSAVLIYCIYYAKSGKRIFIRHIPGLDAIDEAIGRATEMGRSILYVSGTGSIRSIATIASMNMLSRIARNAAEYDTPLIAPCSDAVVMNIEREVVQNAHLDAGRPDTYRQENIFFVSEEQFAYAAAVDGIIMREKPAAIFYMGLFQAESLIFGEVGGSTGAIQIAGTDSTTQLPFFITTCDYTIMGEELYAASAYLSKEPLLLGSLKGQDWGKLIVIAAIILSIAMQILGFNWFVSVFRV